MLVLIFDHRESTDILFLDCKKITKSILTQIGVPQISLFTFDLLKYLLHQISNSKPSWKL